MSAAYLRAALALKAPSAHNPVKTTQVVEAGAGLAMPLPVDQPLPVELVLQVELLAEVSEAMAELERIPTME